MANQVAAIIALFLAIFIPASGASAGSPEDGITAALRGNYAAAIRLWRPLAEDGDVQAQYAIGTMYELGLGVTQNREEAVKWYRRAANLGFADAEYSLAESYENGRRVPRDYEEAANWYRRAAEHGHRLAPENLGIMYLFGSGVAKDHVFASMWFIIAESKGNKAAAQNRKSAEGNMTPAKILGAKKNLRGNGWPNFYSTKEAEMAKIQRGPGNVATRRWGAAYKDLVWALGMSDDFSLSAANQVRRAYQNLDKVLADLGTDKTRILSATVILGDIENKPMADKVWADWMGDNPDHWPERSCHGVDLHAGNAIEIRVVAVRDDPDG